MQTSDPTPPPGAHRTIAVGVIRPHADEMLTAQVRPELAYQLTRTPRDPLTPIALYAAWSRAIQTLTGRYTPGELIPAIAAVVLSMPRPAADTTCGQYVETLRATAPAPAVTA